MAWIDFYDSAPSIYVSDAHRQAHFNLIADDIIGYIASPEATVLDYSCGEAMSANRVAAKCSRLILAEPAPSVRARLADRFAAVPNIEALSPDDLTALPDASLDLIVMISVAQYMTPDELDAAFAQIRRLLKPEGRFMLGDILDPKVGMGGDVLALGRETAINLGVAHKRTVAAILVLVTVLVSVSTALVGPVTFFGLLVANLAYQAAGTSRHAVVLPAAVLLAVICLVGGQLVLERVFSFDTALSIVIEFLGGITFIALVLRRTVR